MTTSGWRRPGASVLTGLAMLFFLAGCGPADLRENLTAYQQLLVLVQAEADPGDLWLPNTAPPDARPLMGTLRVQAVYYDSTAQSVTFRSGGGFVPENGYVYCFPTGGTACAARYEQVAGRWYRYWADG